MKFQLIHTGILCLMYQAEKSYEIKQLLQDCIVKSLYCHVAHSSNNSREKNKACMKIDTSFTKADQRNIDI